MVSLEKPKSQLLPKKWKTRVPLTAAPRHGWSSWEHGAVPSAAQAGSIVCFVLEFGDVMDNELTELLFPSGVGSFQAYWEVGPLKDYSSSTIAWILSLQLFFVFALGPVVGILFDKYGPRPLMIGGTLLHVFGLMMASLASKYYQFLLSQGVCSAIGAACLYSPGKFRIWEIVLFILVLEFYADEFLLIKRLLASQLGLLRSVDWLWV